MKIILPEKISRKMILGLQKASSREIGGILLGEHVNENEFLVSDITIQRIRGGFAIFERLIQEIVEPLKKFFAKTHHNYKRFNYLGEWHSPPSFVLQPSSTDDSTMKEMIDDVDFGANFVVLMIVKLSSYNKLEGTVTVYRNGNGSQPAELVLSKEDLKDA